jgi:hypothetical protein
MMSDLSGLERSFALMPPTMMEPLLEEPPAPALRTLSNEVQPHELAFRRLRGAREIERVLHLRDEIRLSASVLADSSFTLREKKETRSVSSGRSCASARP